MRIALSLVGLLSLLGGVIAIRNVPSPGVKPPVAARAGCTAPDFQLTDTTGRQWRLRELKGEPVLLAFVCGCSTCRRLLAEFARSPLPAGRLLVVSALPPEQIDQLTALSQGRFMGLFDPFARTATVYSSARCPRVWVINREQVISYVSDPERSAPGEVIGRACAVLRGERPGRSTGEGRS